MPSITYTYTNAGHNLMRDGTSGTTNPKITYVALGTGTAAPTTGDTKLAAEVFRKRVSSYTNGTNPGEGHIDLYLAPGDAVGVVIAEVGFFRGNANGSANTGVLLFRRLYPPTQTHINTESIQFGFDLTAGEG